MFLQLRFDLSFNLSFLQSFCFLGTLPLPNYIYEKNLMFFLFFCFSSRIILLFLIAVFSLALPTTTEARSVSSGMNCNTKDSKSYWLRHSCLDGFVVNIGNRVLAQADGLDQHDSRGLFLKIL